MYYTTSSAVWDSALARDLAARLKTLPHLLSHYDSAKLVAQHLGSWCADKHMLEVLSARARGKLNVLIEKDYHQSTRPEDIAHMDKIRSAYHENLSQMEQNHGKSDVLPTSDVWTDKVSVLKKILDDEFAQVTKDRCLVFVERQVTAQMLAVLFERIGHHNLRCGYLVGSGNVPLSEETQTFKEQVQTLGKFYRGDLNCLFATSVAEEGLDIPLCNLVVRFDLYRTMIQYVQSRGRARQDQSKFIHMIDSRSLAQQQLRQAVLAQEQQMRLWCSTLPNDRKLFNDGNLQGMLGKSDRSEERYVDGSTQAMLTSANALGWLGQFVSVMPTESNEPQFPTYITSPVGSQFIAEVILPSGAPIRSVTGKVRQQKLSAKQSAAYKTCLELRKLDLLDAHFMPTYVKKLPLMRNALLAVSMKCSASYDMVTKPKIWKHERHRLVENLYMVVVEFPDGFEHEHRNLILLTRTMMPDFPSFAIVRNDEQDSRVILRTITQPIVVGISELQLLASFTFRIFRDVFSKTYAETVDDLPYFLAPALQVQEPALIRSTIHLDWPLMQAVAAKDCDNWTPASDTTMLLNKFFVDNWDGARKFVTRSIHPTLQPQDAVPGDAANFRWKANILDYSVSLFKKSRAGATWKPAQPVIIAEKMDLRRNMLVPASSKELSLRKKAYICPEPFRISLLPVPVAVACLAWPSVIWRLESVLIALEACAFVGIECEPALALAAITKDSDDSPEAYTLIKLHSGMGENYERLEFLGDCFLKLTTTLAIFVQKPAENEFESHVGRMLLLCNKRLFETSIAMGLPKYIRSKPLSRRLWYPEGLQLLEGKGVNEEQDAYNIQKHALSEKTIADVSEALIGAAFLSHNKLDQWHADHWENAIKAVTKLVGQDNHTMQRWKDYVSAYSIPEYQSRAPTASQKESAAMIERVHDYHFKYPAVLRSAFIHGSQPFMWEMLPSYERLEFLGDALLDMVIITHLFYRFPDKDPQWLTEAKTVMVSNRFFGALACKLGFHKHIRHNNSAIESAIRAYTTELKEKREAIGESRDYWQHVSSPPKCLADLLEAYVGAVFIDSGFDYGQVQRFFDIHMKWHFENMSLYEGYVKGHPVTKLHQLLDTDYGCRMMRVLNTPLPAVTRVDRKELIIGVMIHDKVVAHTVGTSVRYGSVRAAASALGLLQGLTREEFSNRYHCNCSGEQHGNVQPTEGNMLDSS